jgi:hypothetical protein
MCWQSIKQVYGTLNRAKAGYRTGVATDYEDPV